MLHRFVVCGVIVSLLLISANRMVTIALGGGEDETIYIPQSRLYTLMELARLMTYKAREYYVDKRYQQRLMFVSAGRYNRAVFERAIEEGSGLRWREVAGIKFLSVHRDTLPDEEIKNFSQSILRKVEKRFPWRETPFTAKDFRPEQPDLDYRVVAFSSLPLNQQLWLAGRAIFVGEGIGAPLQQRPLTPEELNRSKVTFRLCVVLTVAQYIRVGKAKSGAVIYHRVRSISHAVPALRFPF